MAFDVCFYDYDGVLYAFGVISGYSSVKSVRMYVSDGNGNANSYHSTQIYSKSEADILDSFGTYPFVFNIRTDRDAEKDALKQLPYDVIDPDDGVSKGHYKVSFHFYSSPSKDAAPLNSTVLTPSANGYTGVWYQMHNSLTTPNLTFDASTKKARLSNVGTGRYILEVKRTDRNKVNTGFSPAVKDYAYMVNMKAVEGTAGGRYSEPRPVWVGVEENKNDYCVYCRYHSPWFKGKYWRACVLFDSGASFTEEQKESYLAMAQSAFTQLEEVTGVTIGVTSLVNSTYTVGKPSESADQIIQKYGYGWDDDNLGYDYDMLVRVGNADTLGGDHSWGGFWMAYAWDEEPGYGIATSFACIDTSYDYETLEHIFAEEIFQSLHIGADSFEYPMSRHWDPHYANPNDMNQGDSYHDGTKWDYEVLRFFYSKDLNGYTPIRLLNEMDTPCCLYKDYDGSAYYEFDLSQLANDEYEITGWVAQEGENYGGGGTWSTTPQGHYNWDGGWDDSLYSMKASIIVSLKEKPTPWDWYESNGTASADDTLIASLVCDRKGRTGEFSHKVWNDLVDKTQAFLDYTERSTWTIGSNNYGYPESTTYTALLANAKMTPSDTRLYASKFNILRFCIGVMATFNDAEENNSIYQHFVDTGSWDMARDELVQGRYIIDLARKINQI